MWCHVRMFNPTNTNPQRVKKVDKEIAKSLDYSNIKFPIKEKDYPLIEKKNNTNLNVFYYNNNKTYPLYISKENNDQILNVLLISNEEKPRYVFIKGFNRMMYSQTSTKKQHKEFYCIHCLQNFTTQEILNRHKEKCININGAKKPIYQTGTIKFKNFDKQIPIPFKVYADTECFDKKVNIRKGESTSLYSKHIPYSIAAKLVCIDDTYTQPTKLFLRRNCINEFLQWLFRLKPLCNKIIKDKFNKPLTMTNEEENEYNTTNIWWICSEETIENKVRYRCHIAGKFRGGAHKKM